MAAVITNQGGFYSTFAYVSEARRMGIKILPPDVNKSDIHWKGGRGFRRRIPVRNPGNHFLERDEYAPASFRTLH
jgi:hypothetical protein